MPDEDSKKIAESIISDLNPLEMTKILSEFVFNVGDIVTIPFGVSGKDIQYYQGQHAVIEKMTDKKYTLRMRDGKKIEVERELFDISVVS